MSERFQHLRRATAVATLSTLVVAGCSKTTEKCGGVVEENATKSMLLDEQTGQQLAVSYSQFGDQHTVRVKEEIFDSNDLTRFDVAAESFPLTVKVGNAGVEVAFTAQLVAEGSAIQVSCTEY